MGKLLISVDHGKEEAAMVEILDCIMPHDLSARFSDRDYGGLLLLETSLEPDRCARILAECPTSLVRQIVPLDILVGSSMAAIMEGVASLGRSMGDSSVAVRCFVRGSALSSATGVEKSVGEMLRKSGHSIDLESPALVVRIDIIGERATISVRPPHMMYRKRRGF